MAKTIDMQLMRYINLFEKLSNVSTTNCFVYNNTIIFAVPRNKLSKAIGKSGVNMKRLSATFRKKVKTIEMPEEDTDNQIEKFVSDVVSPVEFSKMEFEDGGAVIKAGRQSKAALIGRNKARVEELEEILKRFFNIPKVRIA
jgi:NusA-like KH domain protein